MIARATRADLPDLVPLIAAFRDWWDKDTPVEDEIRSTAARLLEDPNTEFLLARNEQNQPVGFCQLRYRLSVWTGADDCWLEDLFVQNQAQGRGHGKALVEAAIRSARSRGCKRMELDVNVQNENALAFYMQAGFTDEPKPPGRTLFISRPL